VASGGNASADAANADRGTQARTAKPKTKSRRKHRARKPVRDDRLSTSTPEIQAEPAAQTTTTTSSDPTGSQSGDGEGSIWPLAFAALLGVVILAAIRLAWRRN
jgi:hypothetical protein